MKEIQLRYQHFQENSKSIFYKLSQRMPMMLFVLLTLMLKLILLLLWTIRRLSPNKTQANLYRTHQRRVYLMVKALESTKKHQTQPVRLRKQYNKNSMILENTESIGELENQTLLGQVEQSKQEFLLVQRDDYVYPLCNNYEYNYFNNIFLSLYASLFISKKNTCLKMITLE